MKRYISILALTASVFFFSGCQFTKSLTSAFHNSDVSLSIETPDMSLSVEEPDEENVAEESQLTVTGDDENTASISYRRTSTETSSKNEKKPAISNGTAKKVNPKTNVVPQPHKNVRPQEKVRSISGRKTSLPKPKSVVPKSSGIGKPITTPTHSQAKPLSTGNMTCQVKCPKKGFSCSQLQITISKGPYRQTIRVSNSGAVRLSKLPVGAYTVSISCVDSKKGDGICTPPYSQRSKKVTIQKGQESKVKFE